MGTAVEIVLSGTSQVCCVHDREKRVVTTEKQVAELGSRIGLFYNPKLHKIHRCGCCENLFIDPTDLPRLCQVCLKPNVHRLGGPLSDPLGVVDG